MQNNEPSACADDLEEPAKLMYVVHNQLSSYVSCMCPMLCACMLHMSLVAIFMAGPSLAWSMPYTTFEASCSGVLRFALLT